MQKTRLDEVATVEISSVDKKTKPGQKYVRLCNFTDVYYNWAITQDMHDSFMVASASQKEIDSLSLKRGQVALTKDSETRDDIGISTYIADDFEDVVLGYHTALITPDETKLNGKYLNAFLHTPYMQKYFAFNASGSGQRYTLSIEALNAIQLVLPPLEEQERIGKMFSLIDRKISLNSSIIEELETMIREIYNYWFVQFDFPDENGHPYKSSGGKMVFNEVLKRDIPEGWEVKSLNDIATFTNGIACQKYRPLPNEDKLPVIKIREMHEGITDSTEFATINIPDKVKVSNGDILFSWSASLEVMLWAYGEGALNQHIFKVTSNNGWPKSFYYNQLLSYISVFKKMAEARKTTMGHITQDHLDQSRIVVPPCQDLAHSFENITKSLFNKIIKLSEENTILEKIRKDNLPIIMTGQVSLSV